MDNFYPDFILWIKDNESQRITFVDPKVEFYKKNKELQGNPQAKYNEGTVILNSFIMSITPSLELSNRWKMSKPERESKHVLSLDNDDCIETMLNKILSDNC